MPRFVRVGTREEFEPGRGRLVDVAGQRIAVFVLGAKCFAIDDTCPHRGGPLSEGDVTDGVVTCPLHGARFDLETGAVLSLPAEHGVRCYPVQVNGSDLEVALE